MTKMCCLCTAVSLVALFALPAHAAPIVTNGGFEDVGGTTPGSPGPLTGWTSGDPANQFASSAFPHSGGWAAALGAVDPAMGELSQSLNTTTGAPYTLVYWLYSTGDVPNTFSASWGGNVISGSALTDDTTVAGVYTRFAFPNLIATGPLTTLTFRATNDLGFWHLDDVSLSTTPEPAAVWLCGPVLASLLVLRRQLGRR